MSRVKKYGSRGKHHLDKAAEPTSIETDTNAEKLLPPRRNKFPSSAHKVAKWYYNVLFILFVSLVAGLFWYGTRFTD